MSEAFFYFFVVPPAIALLLLAGWGLTTSRTAAPCCARCRYPTTGLPTPADPSAPHPCPECGADLRAPRGTLPTGARLICRPPRPIAILARLLLVAAVTSYILPRSTDLAPVLAARTSISASSAAGLFTSITVRARGSTPPRGSHVHWSNFRVHLTPVTARLTTPAATVTLCFHSPSGPTTFTTPRGRTTEHDAPTPELILRWMHSAGIDPAHDRAPHEAAAIAALITHVAADGGPTTTPPPHLAPTLTNLTATGSRHIRPHHALTTIILTTAAATALLLTYPVLRWPGPPTPSGKTTTPRA